MVPHYTETWGALRDAETTESIPECVIHSFPTSINHTIGWAKEVLRNHFCDGESGPAQVCWQGGRRHRRRRCCRRRHVIARQQP
jgi:hypothetical protein